MNTQPTDAMRANRTWSIICGLLLIGSVPAEAGLMDTVSSGASYVWQGAKKKANDAWTGVTDSAAGKFISPSERNKRDKERILSVLTYNGAIYRDENGKPQVKDQRKLDSYYQSLQSNGTLGKTPGFSPQDDPDGTKGGQFWRNFLDGKDYTRGDTPAVMDPFENNSSGLATKMHSQLATPTDDASTDYADTAGTLKVRGIDILEKDLRQGVAAGADTYIKALDAITGGTSSQAVKWMEDAAKIAKETADDPAGAAKDYLKEQIKGEMTDKAADALKSALGEDRYDSLMEKYEGYGDKQEQIQKIMEDLARVTGDKRLEDAAKKMEAFSPDAITDGLIQKVLPPGLRDEKEGEEGAEGKDEGQEKDGVGGDIDKPATGDKDPLAPESTLEKEPESETSPEAPAEPTLAEPVAPEEPATTGVEPETGTEPETTAAPEEPGVNEPGEPDSPSTGTAPADDSETKPEGENNPDSGEEPEGGADNGADDNSTGDSSNEGDAPGETTTSSGYVEDANGRITLGETRGPDGTLIKTTTTETDKDGKVIGQTTYEGGTGEGQDTTPNGGLKDAEPEASVDVGPDAAQGGVNTSGSFADNWSNEQKQNTADSTLTMANNTQLTDAANVGNQQIIDAKTTLDSGGRDSQTILDNSAKDTAKADLADSWGKALGDAVENGITEGGKAFGTALGGAAADEVVGNIFGNPKSDSGSVGGEGQSADETPTGGTGQPSASGSGSNKGDRPTQDDGEEDEDDGSSSGEGSEEPGDSGSGGDATTTSAPSDDPLGVRGTTSNDDGTVTIRYGCGYSWTGKPPGPSRCPICARETVSTESNSSPPSNPVEEPPDDTESEPPPPPPPVETPNDGPVTYEGWSS